MDRVVLFHMRSTNKAQSFQRSCINGYILYSYTYIICVPDEYTRCQVYVFGVHYFDKHIKRLYCTLAEGKWREL